MKFIEIVASLNILKALKTSGLTVEEIFDLLNIKSEVEALSDKYFSTIETFLKDNKIEIKQDGTYTIEKDNKKVLDGLKDIQEKVITLKNQTKILNKENFKSVFYEGISLDEIEYIKKMLYSE